MKAGERNKYLYLRRGEELESLYWYENMCKPFITTEWA